MRVLRTAAVAAAVLLAGVPAVPASGIAAPAATRAAIPPAPPCGAPYLIDRAFPSGARWRLCWEMREIEGLTLTHAVYTPRGHRPVSVLRSTHLAQIHVPYDSGEPRFHDMAGSMGNSAVPLQTQDCPNGERREQDHVPLLCVLPDQPRGLAYLRPSVGDDALRASAQGRDLVVFSAFEIGWYTYLAEWRFSDDGTITPRLGATGSLRGNAIESPEHGWPIGVGSDTFEESHSHNAFWRTDFDIEGGADDVVEQYDFAGNGKAARALRRTVVTKEAMVKNSRMRWWRVVDPGAENADGHPVSWEIVNSDSAEYRGPAAKEKFTHGDIYVTQYNRCEHLATENAFPPCRKSVDRYVNGQTITDPVVWVGVDFHHVARDEDEDPMPTHWQGFQIRPRDITAKNPY